MQRNSAKCAHCGQCFYRLSETTPVVNRSDETNFHVTLFFGPDPRPNTSGGFYPGQLFCNFVYDHDRLGTKNEVLLVVILRAKESREAVLQQVEDAADKIVELLRTGEKLESIYTLDGGRLVPGLPS